jgi:hypothetical protein
MVEAGRALKFFLVFRVAHVNEIYYVLLIARKWLSNLFLILNRYASAFPPPAPTPQGPNVDKNCKV